MFKNPVMKEVISWTLHILIALIAGFLIVHFIIQRTVVFSCSMEPTLYEGDNLWVEKVSPKLGTIKAGDIVTIYAPDVVEEESHTIIKRVIAVQNDNLVIKGGKVYVNGKLKIESYLKGGYTSPKNKKYSNLTIPKGYIYVMGDNRENSMDSRIIGPVALKAVTGKAIFRFLPLGRFGPLKR